MLKKAAHPILLTLYFGLFAFSSNVERMQFESVVRMLVVILLFTVALFVVLALLYRDVSQGAFVTSVFVLLFFTYGHLFFALDSRFNLDVVLPPNLEPYRWHAVLLPLWISLLAIAVRLARELGNRLNRVGTFMTLVSGLLLVLAAFNTVRYEAFGRPRHQPDWQAMTPDEVGLTPPEKPPDIYYIILDEYSGNSVLRDFYGYDNSPFTDSLADRGFFVATESRTNYAHTFLSLASSLNVQHLDVLAASVDPRTGDHTVTYHMIDNNLVAQALRDAGYRYVHVSSGWGVTERSPIADEDVIYADLLTINELFFGLFTWLNPAMTPVTIQTSRARTLASFDTLHQQPGRDDGPTFVFAHLLVPHKPYVFLAEEGPIPADGSSVDGVVLDETRAEPYTPYLEQISYTNRMVLELVDHILAESDVPPIIIVQSDHGNRIVDTVPPWGAEEYDANVMPIQNAIYLPDGAAATLYPCITPVNTFRVIFDAYFGTDLGLLEDKSYFSLLETPYDMTELPPHCEAE